jgi:hypothetical protein
LLLDAVPLINCGMNRVIPFAAMHHRLKAQSRSQERPAILIRKGVFKDNMDGCCCIITCRMCVNKSFDLQRFSLSLDGISVVAQQRHAERVLSAGCARRVA